MATIASAERWRGAFQILFRKDYFLGPENLAGARAAIWEECRWHFRD